MADVVSDSAATTPDVPDGDLSGAAKELHYLASGIVLTVGVLFAVWAALTSGSSPVVSPQLLPTIGDTFSALTSDFANASLTSHATATLGRLLITLIVGAPLGWLIGTLAARSAEVRAALWFPSRLFLWLSPVALTPMLILWFGRLDRMWLGTVLAVIGMVGWHVSKADRETGPGVQTIAGIRYALPLVWALTLHAELIGSIRGLGAVIFAARPFFRVDVILAAWIVILVLALAMDTFLAIIGRALSTTSEPSVSPGGAVPLET